MKKISYFHVSFIAVSLFFLWGCQESPTQQLSDAQQALEDARKAGAAVEAPDIFGQAERHLQSATDELQAQDGQFGPFRDYSEAKELLEKAKAAALQAKTTGQAQVNLGAEQTEKKTEETSGDVTRAMTEAHAAVKEAKELLTKAPTTGKDAELVLQIMENDIRSAESTLAKIPKEVTLKDYTMVKEKAEEVENVAARVREQILQAIRKAKGSGQ